MVFSGFSTDNLVSLPPELFTQVLPAITLPSELKVTLHIFYCLSRQRGTPRRITWEELAGDYTLTRSLRSISKLRAPTDLLDEGLSAAVQRTTLLHLVLPKDEGDGRLINWYLVNTAANRAWAEEMRYVQAALAPNESVPEQRPTLLALYEQNIGLVTPLLMDELREAEERYPYTWIEDAIREAVRSNARSWRYVQRVLERWATRGRYDGTNQSERLLDVEAYVKGPYRHLFQRRDQSDESDEGEG